MFMPFRLPSSRRFCTLPYRSAFGSASLGLLAYVRPPFVNLSSGAYGMLSSIRRCAVALPTARASSELLSTR